MEILIKKRNGQLEPLDVEKTKRMIKFACDGLEDCNPLDLEMDAKLQFVENMTTKEIQKILIQSAIEKVIQKVDDGFGNKVNRMTSNWQYVAARLYLFDLYKEAAIARKYTTFGYGAYTDLIKTLISLGNYNKDIFGKYTEEELIKLSNYIKPERDYLFNYEGIKLLSDRYLVKGFNKEVYELPQERFMTIAIHLASVEKDKVYWAKKFYDMLSLLKMTVATPTLANAGTNFPQLSSCFISAVDDSLSSIYDVNTKFSKVSKEGGALGIYVGDIRAINSTIRGYKNSSGGVIPWVRLYNDTAVAVDQLGKRKGSASITLDIWHKDLYDFVELRTNNGDDRRKAHDIFPAVSIPNIFMERLIERKDFSLFDPYEIKKEMGYNLSDYFDDFTSKEFSKRYIECENNQKISKITVPAMDIMKKIMKSAVETGTPFIFFRDTVNRANPNKHCGIIKSSNLCHEITQNMSPSILKESVEENGYVVDRFIPGDMVTCNLNSINLGRYNKETAEEDIATQVRMLDNVISVNMFPVVEAGITSNKYRAIGLGTSGYHHYLVNNNIKWESEDHLFEANELFEDIAYYAIKASMELAKELGPYPEFNGSEWQTGDYFDRRGYISDRWQQLKADVKKYGIRNGYLIAIAPTGSTSNIANTTAGIDPIFKKFFIEEKKGSFTPKTAPDLNSKNMWLYKEAHTIDQQWSIRACGIRQRHIDQAQSFNLYITPDISAKEIFDMYVSCWDNGVKTIYYVRNQSLEMDECTSCSS